MNHHIVAPYLRVTFEGQPLGVLSNRDAQQRAFNEGLDLVEISANAVPPVCQIMDFGKFKYDKGKAQKEQHRKNRGVEMKEVQVTPVIGEHDLATKSNTLKKLLNEGRIVQVTCVFSRRQIMFRELGFEVLKKIADAVAGVGVPERPPQFNEKRLQVRFKPLKEAGPHSAA